MNVTVNNKVYEIGTVMEAGDTGKTMDITVIMDFEPEVPIMVGWYFGEHNLQDTTEYIEEYNRKQAMNAAIEAISNK